MNRRRRGGKETIGFNYSDDSRGRKKGGPPAYNSRRSLSSRNSSSSKSQAMSQSREDRPSRSYSVSRRHKPSAAEVGETIPTNDDSANKFVQYTEFGTDPLQICRVVQINEIPAIQSPDDVIVKVKASTVSIKDCYIRRGIWNDKINIPNVTGFDCVGCILAMGKNAWNESDFEIGEAVAACCRTGGNARYVVLKYQTLVRVPGAVDSGQAACIISTYMTAYQALHREKPRRPKETLEGSNILITGGNGPVGQAIIELGFRAGASKIFVTADDKFHPNLLQQGVCPLPLDADEWLPMVKGRMDIVIDGICQDSYASPRAALNRKGHLIIIGMTQIMNSSDRGWVTGTPVNAIVTSFSTNFMTQTSRYCPYESSQKRSAEWKHDLSYLMALLERGKLSPVVTARISLDHIPHTQDQLEKGKLNGLIVCKPWK